MTHILSKDYKDTYKGVRRAGAGTGAGVGALAGAVLGHALAKDPTGGDSVVPEVTGGSVGAVLGAAAGHSIAKWDTSPVTYNGKIMPRFARHAIHSRYSRGLNIAEKARRFLA